MNRRVRPVTTPVTVTFDGQPVVAERGEPLAASLLAAGDLKLARSPKFHRPRGPSCMRGACDGCLARVAGVPNVPTCLVPAEDGLVVHSQNTLGSREVDLLRVTDWFFPDGMNHHELFAGVPGVQGAMQAFARRVAGLGKLPDALRAPRGARRRALDVFIVGAGPAGMAAALAARQKGRRVEVVDDALAPGGGARALFGPARAPFEEVHLRFTRSVADGGVTLRLATVAAGFYGRDLLVGGPDGAEVVSADSFVLATGAHDGVAAFENNDVPGVMSARAACMLLTSGVVVGEPVVVLEEKGGGGASFGRAYAAAMAKAGRAKPTFVRQVLRVVGASRVKGVVVPDDGGERTLPAEALFVDVPRAPAHELLSQAGAVLSHAPAGFVGRGERGKVADGMWAIGEVLGAPLDAAAFERAAGELF